MIIYWLVADIFVVPSFSGLNCAEAVNFAPADWLPHGGFGADRYQMYHKTAVLSHEELLCVVAKFVSYLHISTYSWLAHHDEYGVCVSIDGTH